MKKKFLAVLLAGVLTVGTASVPQAAFATGAETADSDAADSEPETLKSEDGKWEYYVDEEKGGAVISKYLGEDVDLKIPETLGEKPVVDLVYGTFGTDNDPNDTITSLFIPDNLTSVSLNALNSLEKIEVGINNEKYTSKDGVLFNKEKTFLLQYPSSKKDEEYTIPDGVTYVGISGPLASKYLSKLVISKDVNDLDHLTVSAAVYPAYNLKEIEVVKENQKYSSEDGVLFNYDKTRILRYPPLKEGTSYVIPESVTSLGVEFMSCNNLTNITVSNNLFSISPLYMDNLKTITYLGTMEEFGKVVCESGAVVDYLEDYGLGNVEIKCTDGVINKQSTTEENPEPEDKPSSGSSSSGSSGSTTTPEPTEYTDGENETGVTASADEGVLPDGAKLKVTPASDSANENQFTYDISFTDADGNEIQPNGNVTVKIPVPETFKDVVKIYVYRIETDGRYTHLEAEIKDGYIVFTTNHFSKYLVTTEEIKAETPAPETPKPTDTTPADTTTNPNTGVAVALIPVILAGAVVIVSAKKRK